MFNPFTIYKDAIRSVPVIRYAIGVSTIVGIVAAIGSVRADNIRGAFLSVLVMLILMLLLILIARVAKVAPDSLLPPIKAFVWIFLMLGAISAALTVTSVFFDYPKPFVEYFPFDNPSKGPKVSTVRREIVVLRAAWETLHEGNRDTIQRVYSDGVELAERILKIRDGLNLGQRIDREEWAGYAYLMAADAAHRLNETAKRDDWIDASLLHLKNAEELVAQADRDFSQPDATEYAIKLQGEIYNCFDRERIAYLKIMAASLDYFGRRQFQRQKIVADLEKLDGQRLRSLELIPKHTPYLGEILSNSTL